MFERNRDPATNSLGVQSRAGEVVAEQFGEVAGSEDWEVGAVWRGKSGWK